MSNEVRDDIRTTSLAITADAEQLAHVERRKLDPAASDEDLKRLAAKAEELARSVMDKTRIEKKLVDQAVES